MSNQAPVIRTVTAVTMAEKFKTVNLVANHTAATLQPTKQLHQTSPAWKVELQGRKDAEKAKEAEEEARKVFFLMTGCSFIDLLEHLYIFVYMVLQFLFILNCVCLS